MQTPTTIQPAFLPMQKLSVQMDWMVTLKCNYDCAYCGPSGHDNTQPHPPIDRCLKSLTLLYKYSDMVNSFKKKIYRDSILNITGGEAINHPDIIEIMQKSTDLYAPYQDRWKLTKRLTTNATIQPNKWVEICKHLQGATISYHSQGPDKLKNNVKENILLSKELLKEYDVHVLMYPNEEYWKDIIAFVDWCKHNDVNIKPKLLDGPLGFYNKDQLLFLNQFLDTKNIMENNALQNQGRACCGGRSLCINNDLKTKHRFINRPNNDYRGWYCSVNNFFIFADTVKGTFSSNKDCRTNLTKNVGPMATLDNMEEYIETLRKRFINQQNYLICTQSKCRCGICAPKATTIDDYKNIIKQYMK